MTTTPDNGQPHRVSIRLDTVDADEFLLIREVLIEEGYTELGDTGTWSLTPR
jgi:hypothetical protein